HPAANSWRTRSWWRRASAHSRRWACDLRGGRRPAFRATASPRGGGGLQDAADHDTAGQHIVNRHHSTHRTIGALKDQIVLVHSIEPTCDASFDHLVGASEE